MSKDDNSIPMIYLNGYVLATNNPKELYSSIMVSVEDLKYWSYVSLWRFYRGLNNILIQYSKLMRTQAERRYKARYTVFIRRHQRYKLFPPRKRNELLKRIYNSILICEGFFVTSKR